MRGAAFAFMLLLPTAVRAEGRGPGSGESAAVSASTAPVSSRGASFDSSRDPRIAPVKAEIREALLAVRRARYALRKAEGARDPLAVEAARARFDEAKAALKTLRAKLRALLSAGAAPRARARTSAPGGAAR